MPEPKVNAAKNPAATEKINWKALENRATEMKDELTVVHEQITEIWKKEKCRELATIESAVRNSVEYLAKMPDAIQRYFAKNGKGGNKAKGSSILSKPR